jgi:hypothetical protein
MEFQATFPAALMRRNKIDRVFDSYSGSNYMGKGNSNQYFLILKA